MVEVEDQWSVLSLSSLIPEEEWRERVMLLEREEKVAVPMGCGVGEPEGSRREMVSWGLLCLEDLTWWVGCGWLVWGLRREMVALEVERREVLCGPVKIRCGVGRIWI